MDLHVEDLLYSGKLKKFFVSAHTAHKQLVLNLTHIQTGALVLMRANLKSWMFH